MAKRPNNKVREFIVRLLDTHPYTDTLGRYRIRTVLMPPIYNRV